MKPVLLIAAALAGLSSAAQAEWPDHAVQMIVPFPAGGTIDVVARRFAQAFSEQIKQPVPVMNRDGASGTIGTTAVVNSQADGNTVGFIPNGPLTVQPTLNPKLNYAIGSLKPVCQVFSFPFVLAVRADSPYKSLQDFLKAARAAAPSKELTSGYGGFGTAAHFALLETSQASKVKVLGVAFRGDPPVALALKGGDIESAVLTVEVVRQQGFKPLAVFADQRLSTLPQVPTAREQGIDVVASTTNGLFAPARTPAAVVSKMETACAAATSSRDFRDGMKQMNQTVNYLDSEKFESILRADAEIKRRLIQASGIQQE
ncbi:tripartite tricarboxylate transporter substrate binding protein [Variovorax robiniae]|uniref:Tripartite tricarboxylate transporter substrate binding protein n=1 Tax=Variovorax robiniae TaxID=1836199 RepID=A0ABU8X7I9_9BURK